MAERNGFVFYIEPLTFGVNTAYWGPENRAEHSAIGADHEYGAGHERHVAALLAGCARASQHSRIVCGTYNQNKYPDSLAAFIARAAACLQSDRGETHGAHARHGQPEPGAGSNYCDRPGDALARLSQG